MPETMMPDETRCPLCGKLNACGAHDSAACWCMAARIPQGLVDMVPKKQRMKACICQKCVERFQQNQQQQ